MNATTDYAARVHRLGQKLDEITTKALEATGSPLTPRQFLVLQTIDDCPGLSQTDIVNKTRVDRSTLADIVIRLQKRGLIKRTRSKVDSRAYTLRLTEDGARLLNVAKPKYLAATADVFAGIPKAKMAVFTEVVALILQENG